MPKPRSGLPTKKSKLFLRQLEAFGAGLKLKDFCDSIGVAQHTVFEWRRGIVGFRDEENAIRAKFSPEKRKKLQAEHEDLKHEFSTIGLDELEVAWLKAYAPCKDRLMACAAVGVRWAYIEKRLDVNADFKAQYDALFRERIIAAADALGRRAAEGTDTTATKEFLRAFDPGNFAARLRHEGQITHSHVHRVMERNDADVFRQKWLASFNGQLEPPKALPAEAPVVEGELVAE